MNKANASNFMVQHNQKKNGKKMVDEIEGMIAK